MSLIPIPVIVHEDENSQALPSTLPERQARYMLVYFALLPLDIPNCSSALVQDSLRPGDLEWRVGDRNQRP